MRTLPGEGEFAAWLLQVGNGSLNDTSTQPEIIKIPLTCVCEEDLVDEIYSTASSNNLHNRVILSPKNKDCFEINEKVLETISGETRSFLSIDSVKFDNERRGRTTQLSS